MIRNGADSARIADLQRQIAELNVELAEARQSRRDAEVAIEELHHRFANTLAMVSSIVRQSVRSARSTEEASTTILRRLAALMAVNALLVNPRSVPVDVREILDRTIKPYDEQPSRFIIQGTPQNISTRAAMALTLTINELCTNATKYGALSTAKGRVRVEWKSDAATDRFELTWSETGGPPVTTPTRTGFGSKLIEQAFARQFGGSAMLEFSDRGVTCRLVASSAAISA